MANCSKATITLTIAALLLSLLLVHVAESRVLPKSGSAPPSTDLICADTYGAEAGETCFGIAESFNLTAAFFSAINPNLDCNKIFIARWLCVDGFTI